MPIQLDDNAKMHFRNGFAVTSGDTKFFTYDGAEMSLPFAQQIWKIWEFNPLLICQPTIMYWLITDIYTVHPKYLLKLVYGIPEEFDGWDIKELDDMLLFVLKDSKQSAKTPNF